MSAPIFSSMPDIHLYYGRQVTLLDSAYLIRHRIRLMESARGCLRLGHKDTAQEHVIVARSFNRQLLKTLTPSGL